MGFRLRVAAENDLVRIGLLSRERWGAAQMRRYLTKLDEAIRMLGDMPNVGRACDEIYNGCRRFHEGHHVIFYEGDESGDIEVVRILHESMQHDWHVDP